MSQQSEGNSFVPQVIIMRFSHLCRMGFVIGLTLINATVRSDELKIGVIVDLSRPTSVGHTALLGARAAIDDAASSGMLRDHILLVAADDQCRPDVAKRKAQELIQRDQIKLAIGHSCPSSSLAASDAYNAARVIQIDPVTTDPVLTERLRGHESFLFRVSERQDRAAVIAVFVLRDHVKNMKVRLIGDSPRQPWSDRVKQQIGAVAASVEVVETVPNAKSADAVSVLYDPYNRNGPISEASDDIVYVVQGPTAGSSVPLGNRDLIQKLSSMAKSAGYSMPIGPAINAYAAVEVWVKAVTEARTSDSARVIEQMRRLTFNTVRGPIAFDETGDVRQPVITIVRHTASGPIIQVPNQCNEDKCKNCACTDCCPK
jgi:branched-chain amino acid transport system substrate-binding protein